MWLLLAGPRFGVVGKACLMLDCQAGAWDGRWICLVGSFQWDGILRLCSEVAIEVMIYVSLLFTPLLVL